MDAYWPILVGLNLLPLIPSTLLFFYGVESPKYVYNVKNDPKEAKNGRINNFLIR